MLRLILLVGLVQSLIACSGGESAGPDTEGTTSNVQFSGAVVDDYLVGSEVVIDLGPSAPEDTQLVGLTDADGNFEINANFTQLSAWSGEITSWGGFNKITSEEFLTPMRLKVNASDFSTGAKDMAITPITTLMANVGVESIKNRMAECLLGAGKTGSDLNVDFIEAGEGNLTALAMKLQKSTEMIQAAVSQGVKDLAQGAVDLGDLDITQNADLVADLVDAIDQNAVAQSAYKAYAAKLQNSFDFDTCGQADQPDPITAVVTDETVLDEMNMDTILTGSDKTILQTSLDASANNVITLQQLIPDTSSASNLKTAINDFSQQVDLAKQQSVASNLEVEKVLLSSELMKDQGVNLIQTNQGNMALAGSVLATTEAVDRSEVDYESLSAAITQADAETTTSFSQIKDQADLYLGFATSLATSYTKLVGEDKTMNLYFFTETEGYACIVDREDVGEEGTLKTTENVFPINLTYSLYRSNGMLLNLLGSSGKWVVNRASNQDGADIKSMIDAGDGVQTYYTSAESDYFTLKDDESVGYKRLSFVPFNDMINHDSNDVDWINSTSKTVDCSQVTYLAN